MPPTINKDDFSLAKLTIQLCGHEMKPLKLSVAMSTIVYDHIMEVANQWKVKIDADELQIFSSEYKDHVNLANKFKMTGFKRRIMNEYYILQRLRKEFELTGETCPF